MLIKAVLTITYEIPDGVFYDDNEKLETIIKTEKRMIDNFADGDVCYLMKKNGYESSISVE